MPLDTTVMALHSTLLDTPLDLFMVMLEALLATILDTLLDLSMVIQVTVPLEADEVLVTFLAMEEALDEAPELLETTVPEGPGASAALASRAGTAASRSTAGSSTIRPRRSFRSSTAAPGPSTGSRRRPST